MKGYHDISPRMGAAYDVFGNGKTALKVNIGQYLQGAYTGDAYTISNPGQTLVTSINRSWSDPNGNRVAECDFLNSAANGECGAWSVEQLGLLHAGHHRQSRGPRRAGARAIGTGSTASACSRRSRRGSRWRSAYNRRVWSNFFVTHNRALTAADYDEVTLTAPLESAPAQRRRLPGHVPHAQHAERPRRDGFVLHDRRRLRRRNALLARR